MRKMMKVLTILLICIVFGGIILLGMLFDVIVLDDVSDAFNKIVNKTKRRKNNEE